MKVVVQFSGGKDSHAALIWSVKRYGANNVTALFCNTHWEHPSTYLHIKAVTSKLGVPLITLDSVGFLELARQKKRFPSMIARFCTDFLKIRPFIDWVLEQSDHLIIVQGIRAEESTARAKMQAECRYFRFYFEPFGHDKHGKPKLHTYRKKDVHAWCSRYADDVLRPVFKWTGQEVINYILKNGHKPNPLYYQGSQRVGCYPCVLSSQTAIKAHFDRNPSLASELTALENELSSPFFKWDTVPERLRTGTVPGKPGVKFSTATDIYNYLQSKNATLSMFEDDTPSCSSYYHLCE